MSDEIKGAVDRHEQAIQELMHDKNDHSLRLALLEKNADDVSNKFDTIKDLLDKLGEEAKKVYKFMDRVKFDAERKTKVWGKFPKYFSIGLVCCGIIYSVIIKVYHMQSPEQLAASKKQSLIMNQQISSLEKQVIRLTDKLVSKTNQGVKR